MAGPSWDGDDPADDPIIGANTYGLICDLHQQRLDRVVPTLAMLQHWHTELYAAVTSVPTPVYVGNFRGDPDIPELVDYPVYIGANGQVIAKGANPEDVFAELHDFEATLQGVVANLDAQLPAGERPSTEAEVRAVVQLAAVAHGELVRIHPFANGNGRIARTLANWVLMRYGFPPFVRVKPRPGAEIYGQCALRSMTPPNFDHIPTFHLFVTLFSLT